jgi:DNA-binding NtrC family response regulator
MSDPKAGGRPPIRVLFLDDEVPIVSVITKLLQKKGYSVVAAHSAEEARRLLETGPAVRCAVVDVDLGVGKENGVEVVAWLRATRPKVGVVVASAHAQPALPPGIMFLPKPFTTDQLCDAIERECAS